MSQVRQRALNVLQFLRALQEMRTRPVRDVARYPDVLWLGDIRADHTKTACAWNSDLEAKEGLWFSLSRIARTQPPLLPEILEPWVSHADILNSLTDQPRLHDEAELPIEVIAHDGELDIEFRITRLGDHPDVSVAYDEWLPGWQTWADHDRSTMPLRAPYQSLYSMYQRQRAEPERLELVLGMGLLSTSTERYEIRRHLITAPATVNLDLETGQLDVQLDPEHAQVQLEEDMLATADRVPPNVSEQIQVALSNLPMLFGDDGVEQHVREWTNAFSSDAVYSPNLTPSPPPRHGTTVTFAPALILRQRGRQSFVQSIQTIEEGLENGAEIPVAMHQLLADPDDEFDHRARPTDGRSHGAGHGSAPALEHDDDPETYFIKQANPQQLEVAARLREHQIVVVQGPPGTGKTHTITNLMTDLLAHGKRVLVTSHSSQALNVIKGMLPHDVRDLCVSLTDTSVKGRNDLRRSVNTIIDETTSRTIKELDDDHLRLRQELSDARGRKDQALKRLRSIREQETRPADASGPYHGTPQQVAQQLAADERRFGWIGTVDLTASKVSRDELNEFVALIESVTDDVLADAMFVPDTTSLLRPDDLRNALDQRGRQAERLQQFDVSDHDLIDAVSQSDPHVRDQLQRGVAALTVELQPIRATGYPWVDDRIGDLWNGRDAVLNQLLSNSKTVVEANEHDLSIVGHSNITGLDKLDVNASSGRLHKLAEHFAAGGALRGKLGRTPATVRECEAEIQSVRIDGRPITNASDAKIAAAACAAELRLDAAQHLWNLEINGQLGMRAAQLKEMTATLSRIVELKPTIEALRNLLYRVPNPTATAWTDPTVLDKLSHIVHREKIAAKLAEFDAGFESLTAVLSDALRKRDVHPAVSAAQAAVVDKDVHAYTAAWSTMCQAEEANRKVERLKELHRKLKASLPDVAAALKDGYVPPEIAAGVNSIEAAYLWAEWDEWLKGVVDPAEETRQRNDLEEARASDADTLRRIAANRAWRYCQSRMTRAEQQNLKLYAQATNKIGKGTGKHAPRYRAQARDALQKAQSAVPAWIMSLQSVVDSVSFTKPGIFDVVIVDEASQSGHEALLLTWLANQVLVVGDGEQISPENVGIDSDGVFHLQNELLADLPTMSAYGPNNSFLEHAEAVAPSPVMLREHFRCMPEIIEFSNQLSYHGRLLPVRQHGLDRLDPLRRTYIADAKIRGKSGGHINAAEAEQIVETIAKCCTETAYDEKTMGVITLLGSAQHKYIADLLLERLGTEEVEKRRLLTSSPAAFQGDERHVIFMSLVASPHGEDGPRRIGALTRREDQQRLNVAASRARDQVWVFHSVTQDELPSRDLRRQYLDYLSDDGSGSKPMEADTGHQTFASLLEKEIHSALTSRGYHVRVHAKAAGHHIDLVVVGAHQQLAIECDGDELDASDTGDQALRQGDLERLGWQFWRIRGSQYFRDPERSLEPLWDLLDELGIRPINGEVRTGTVVDVVAPPPVNVEDIVDEAATVTAIAPVVEHVSSAETSEHEAPFAAPAEPISPPAERSAPEQPPSGLLVGKQSYTRLQLEVEAIDERLERDQSAETARQQRAKTLALGGRIQELAERRAWLQHTLNEVTVVDDHMLPDSVWPGAVIKLRDDDREIECYVASVDVGEEHLERYGPTSPVGTALRDARAGQRVSYTKNNGNVAIYDVLAIID